MLVISEQQLSALESGRIAAFRVAVARELTGTDAARAVDPVRLDDWIRQGIRRARELRIDGSDDLLRFLRLRGRHGDDFDRLGWARPLHSSEPSAALRLAAAEALAPKAA